jgi:hypothetical protein
VFRAKAVIVCAGGASHIFKPARGRRGNGAHLVCAVEQRRRPTACRSRSERR